MTALDQATLERAIEIHGHQRLCRHEAGHATAAALLGLHVYSVRAGFHTLAELEHGDPDEAAGEAIIRRPEEHSREAAITVLAGPMCDQSHDWPPPMVVATHAPDTPDERQLGEYVSAVGLDKGGYTALCDEARALTQSPALKRLHGLIVDALADPPHTIGPAQVHHLKHIAERADMEHLTLKAVVAATTDEGTFGAVISTEGVDRERDVVLADAMVKALQAWTATGKLIPLAWAHSSAPEDIIGHIDPASAKAVSGEVHAAGWIDQTTDRGREAWRLVKSGTLGFSFGYLVTDAVKRADGVREIRGLDVFEVSGTTTPMNNGTRVTGWKSLDSDLDHVRIEWRDQMTAVLNHGQGDPGDRLRVKAQRIARECAPVQVKSFEC